jgi:hypothetical protein
MDAVRQPDEILNELNPPAAAELYVEAFLLAFVSSDPAPMEDEPGPGPSDA